LEAPLLECPRPERSVGVEPEIAALAESHFRGVRAKEIQRRAAGLDVHRLPPGGPRPARVELRGGGETGEIEGDHDDAVKPPPCEGPGNPGPDDATADDEDPHPLHAVRVAETAAPCTLQSDTAASRCPPAMRAVPPSPSATPEGP